LTDADIELLCRRTEGWVAGLYLAALSLVGRCDATAFITTFAGDNRHIVDYLMAEVLDGQPPQLRSFLLRTSVLHRLSGTLCDAVLQTTGSASVLVQIERENLFLVPLDLSRHWYRYHHLFGELLRTELRRAEPGLAEILHGRAAVWFEAEGLIDETVRHLVAAGDIAGSADLIAADWVNEFHGGGLSTVSAWLDLLPAQTVWRDSRLGVARAWVALNLGQLETALSWIEAAEDESTACASDGETIATQLIVLRAIHSFKTGRLTAALKGAGRAVTLDFGDAPLAPSGARSIYGSALYFSGSINDAAAAFEQAVALAEAAGDRRTRVNSLGYLAMIAAERGQLADAEQRIHRATGSHADLASGEHFIDAMVSLAAATVLLSRGDTTAAAEAAQVAVAASRQGGGILEVAQALLVRANILERRGDRQGAEADRTEAGALLAEAEASAADSVTPRNARSAVGEELTLKELEVLRLLATQLSRREIAQRLYVSLNTVKSHQRAVYRKLAVADRASAVTRAHELGLL
jgi:LuxR family transcriptional regulator, maltose regulon positive regulatory protein